MNSAKKGAGGERELLEILRNAGYDVRRRGTESYGQWPDLEGMPGVHAEIKQAENARLYEWMEQSERDAARFGDGLPTVFWRKNRQPWLVIMTLGDWLRLYGQTPHGININKKEI